MAAAKRPQPRRSLGPIPAYVPGTRSAPGFDESRMLRLASNESSWGSSVLARKAFLREAKNLHRYPEAGGPALRKALGRGLGLHPDQVLLGAGSNEVLVLLALAFLEPGTSALMADQTFPIYERATRMAGAKPLVVSSRNFKADLPALARAATAKTRLAFLANPNNPTGTVVSDRELRSFLRDLPGTCLVVLDEAYREYMTAPGLPDGLALLKEGKNIASVRTFSKMYGLAALRIGYGLVPAWAWEAVEKVRQPFNVGSPSVAAAVAALADRKHVRRVRDLVARGRKRLEKELVLLGLPVLQGQGNFVFIPMIKPSPLATALLKKGIATRPIAGLGLRVTVGKPAENNKLLDAVRAWVRDR